MKYSKYTKQSLLYIVLIDGSLLFVSTARPMQLVEFNDPRSKWVNAILDVYFSTGHSKHTKTACTAFLNSREGAKNSKAFKEATLELGEKTQTRLSPVPLRSFAPVFVLFARPFCTFSWLSRKRILVVQNTIVILKHHRCNFLGNVACKSFQLSTSFGMWRFRFVRVVSANDTAGRFFKRI